MRLRNLILCLLFCIASASAKDVITKTDGTKLDAKVEEITETLIKYRKASNPTGPIYTIALESVATIRYENGEVDTFKESTNTSVAPSQKREYQTDDELMTKFALEGNNNLGQNYSDYQLLKIYDEGNGLPDDVMQRVKKYRKIGWYGGVGLLAVGVICGVVVISTESDSDVANLIGISLAGLGAGAIWCLGYNLKANSLMKEARQMQSYSTTIIENDILKFGDNSLTAGINVMGNRMVNSHSIGLSLGLNF